MTKRAALENDYERMVPEFHDETITYAEHITRYLAAEDIVKGKVVLDIASGSGYGTQILANSAKKVYGVDIEEKAVAYARQNFGRSNLEYRVGGGEAIPLEDNSVDIVITFETIEHIKDYRKFVKEIKRVLKDDGLAVVSTPNDLEFAEGNHFHLHEFEHQELLDLLHEDFANTQSYFQGTWKYVAVGSAEELEHKGKLSLPTLNLAPKDPSQHLYFYILCSNRKIVESITPIAALGEHYSDRRLVKEKSDFIEKQKALQAELTKLKQDSSHNIKYLEQKIQEIQSSKAYRSARMVSRIKNRTVGKKSR